MSTSDTKKGPRVTPPIRNRMIPRFHELGCVVFLGLGSFSSRESIG